MIQTLIELMKTCVGAADEIASEHRLGSEDKSKLAMTLFLEASRRNAAGSRPGPSSATGTGDHAHPHTPEADHGFNGNGNGRVTSRQLAAIFAIGKAKGLTQMQVKSKVKEVSGKMPDYLTRAEASDCIGVLQTLPDRNGR